MKNYLITTMALLLVTLNVLGQNDIAKYKTGNADLRKFLVQEFNNEAKSIKIKECVFSVIFSKFSIDTVGNIKGISFSSTEGSPQVFRNILQKIIMATNGKWIPAIVNGNKNISKPFILPLLIELEANCASKDFSTEKIYKKEIPNFLTTNILYMLEYEDNVGKDNNQLDCVFLKPLRIFAQN